MNFSKQPFVFTLLLFSTLFLFTSCDKDDTEAPQVEFISPEAAEEIHGGMLHLNINFTDNEELASYDLTIISLDGSHTAHEESGNLSGKTFNLDVHHELMIPDHSDYILTLTLVDKAGNETVETIQFHMHPTSMQSGTGAVMMNFKLQWGDEPFEMFKHYTYPGGDLPFFLTRFSFYISDIFLVNQHGHETKILEPYFNKYMDLTEDHLDTGDKVSQLHIHNVPAGEYTGIKFNIGLSEGINSLTPASFSADDDLSLSGEYWASWSSYIFCKIEGKGDDNGDAIFDDPQISLHLGSDDALRTANFTKDINVHDGMMHPLNVVIDVQKVFDNGTSVYDLFATKTDGANTLYNYAIHNLNQIPEINVLSDNLLGAMGLE